MQVNAAGNFLRSVWANMDDLFTISKNKKHLITRVWIGIDREIEDSWTWKLSFSGKEVKLKGNEDFLLKQKNQSEKDE